MSLPSPPNRRGLPYHPSRSSSLGGLEKPVPPVRPEWAGTPPRLSPSLRSHSGSSGSSNLNKPLPPSPHHRRKSSSNYSRTQDEIIDSYRARDNGSKESLPKPVFANPAATQSSHSLRDVATARQNVASNRSQSAAPDPATRAARASPPPFPRVRHYSGGHASVSPFASPLPSPLASPPITASARGIETPPKSPPWLEEPPRRSHWERRPSDRARDLASEYQQELTAPGTTQNALTMPYPDHIVFASREASPSPHVSARITNPADPSLVPPPLWLQDASRSPLPMTRLPEPQDPAMTRPKPYPTPLSPSSQIPDSYRLEDEGAYPGRGVMAPAAQRPATTLPPFHHSWSWSGQSSGTDSGSEDPRPSDTGPTFEEIAAAQERRAREVRSPAIPITPYQQMGPKAWAKEAEAAKPPRRSSARKLLFGKRNSREKEREREEQRREDLKKTIRVLDATAKTSLGIDNVAAEAEGSGQDSKGHTWI